jgi:YMGG-like Gly-zipper
MSAVESVRLGGSKNVRGWKRSMAIGIAGLACMFSASGCSNAGEGAASGAALGALGGLAIGSLTGDMGKGAVVGAVLGGLSGLVIGDQNERADRRSGR